MFSYFMMFLTSQCSKLDRFIVYLVHSLSTWFTHSFIFPSFQVRYCHCFCRSCSYEPWWKYQPSSRIGGYFLLIIHWTVLKWFDILYVFRLSYLILLWVLGYTLFQVLYKLFGFYGLFIYDGICRCFNDDLDSGYLERDLCWLWIQIVFLIGFFIRFINETLLNFR